MPQTSALKQTDAAVTPQYSWIQMVADTISRFGTEPGSQLSTFIQPCVIRGEPSIVHEKNLHESCSTLYHYLQNFAFCNELKLVEDRRTDRIEVVRDRRQSWAPIIALGAGMMLRETNLAVSDLAPSTPHELRSGEPDLSPHDMISLAAGARSAGSHTELGSNGMLIPNNLGSYTIDHHQSETELFGVTRSVSYFEGKNFHALGYHSGDQIVLNVLVGGGPFSGPRLWGPVQRMARDPVQLHYFAGNEGRDGFGVCSVAYYLDSAS